MFPTFAARRFAQAAVFAACSPPATAIGGSRGKSFPERDTSTAMPAFRYEAVDARGKPRRGQVDAETARQVRDRLRGDGLFPTAVEPVAPSAASPAAGVVERTRLPAGLVALTTRQLATLVRSGMPLDQALGAVAEQADDARAAGVFVALRAQVAAGESLAAALARWPRTFSELYRGLTAVGAETGRLADVRPAWPTIWRRARRSSRSSRSR